MFAVRSDPFDAPADDVLLVLFEPLARLSGPSGERKNDAPT
jgi:hypothetical protein